MIEVMFVFILLLIIIQILLLTYIKKSDKFWIFSIITVLISVLVFGTMSQIESIVHTNSPGLGEIGTGIITALIRIISLILSEIILYKSVKKYLIKTNVNENNNYKVIKFLIAFSITFICFIIFIISQVGIENFGI